MLRVVIVFLAAATLASCRPGGPTNSDSGAVVGAITGGIIGNQFGRGGGRTAATAVGIVLGGIIGSEIGRSLDEADRRAAARAEYIALERGESGVATPWRNPDSGHYGTVVPDRAYRRAERDCRDYTHTIYIDGRRQALRGTACRNPDGTWQPVG